jgi:hypothetical protein
MSTTFMIHASSVRERDATPTLAVHQERLVTTADDPSFLSKTPDQVETGIAREIRKYLPVLDARDTAGIAMVPVRPVLEAQAAEIARLRNALTEGVTVAAAEQFEGAIRSITDEVMKDKLAEIEASVRASERARCGSEIRTHAARLRDAAGDVFTKLIVVEATERAADLIDAQGPVQGARAAGGTE